MESQESLMGELQLPQHDPWQGGEGMGCPAQLALPWVVVLLKNRISPDTFKKGRFLLQTRETSDLAL